MWIAVIGPAFGKGDLGDHPLGNGGYGRGSATTPINIRYGHHRCFAVTTTTQKNGGGDNDDSVGNRR